MDPNEARAMIEKQKPYAAEHAKVRAEQAELMRQSFAGDSMQPPSGPGIYASGVGSPEQPIAVDASPLPAACPTTPPPTRHSGSSRSPTTRGSTASTGGSRFSRGVNSPGPLDRSRDERAGKGQRN